MRPWLSIAAFAFSIAAAMAEDLPPVVQKAIAENKRDCKTVALEKGFITRKDINGDGRTDFVLDYDYFICDGNPRAFCGSIGCATQVFASLPNGTYAKVVDENVRRIDFRQVEGRPAIVVGLAGDADLSKGPDRGLRSRQSLERLGLRGHTRPENEWNGRIKNGKSLGPIRAVLAEVLAMYGKGQMGPFASDAVMRKHFTAQFISLWDRAIARNDGTIDSDLLRTGGELGEFAGRRHYCGAPNAATVEMHRLREPIRTTAPIPKPKKYGCAARVRAGRSTT